MLVSQSGLEGPTISWDGGDPQETTLTVATVVLTESVAQGVVEQLNRPELSAREVLANTSVERESGTMFIDVSYKDPDPKRAQLITNTIGQVVSEKILEVSLGASAITATVWEPATLPKTPVSPDPVRNMLLALATWGLMLGLLITARASLGNPMCVPQKNVFPSEATRQVP
jgi:capsular polysaccharide biosynthesis protein